MKLKSLLIVALFASLFGRAVPPAVAAPQSINITNPASDVIFEEADEYGTLVWNDPWDMSQALDVQQLVSPRAVYANYFSSFVPCAAGLWCGQVRSDAGNPDLFLLHPGYPGALHIGRDGNRRPIDASKYTRLTFRMYLDSVPAGAIGWQALWTTGTIANFCDAQCRQTVFFQLYSGWNIYSVNFPTSRLSGLNWSGSITGLRLDIGNANMQNHVVYLDWARLSGPNGDNRPIQWTQSGQTGNVNIQFRSSDGATTP